MEGRCWGERREERERERERTTVFLQREGRRGDRKVWRNQGGLLVNGRDLF